MAVFVPRSVRFVCAAAVLAAGLPHLMPEATAQVRQSARGSEPVYASIVACRNAARFSDDICRQAAINAQAEFQEKAPRFDQRAACERAFGAGRCGLSIGGSNVAFVPRLAGFRISGAPEPTVVPVIDGRGAVRFDARSAQRPDAQSDPARAAAAQARWRASTAPAPRRGARAGVVPPGEGRTAQPSLFDSNGDPSGPALSFPVSPQRLRQMREDAAAARGQGPRPRTP